MISRARWQAGLLLVLVAFVTQGCKLPSGQPGDVPVTLSLSNAGAIIIHPQDTLEVVARDPQGRQIADPAIDWRFGVQSVNVLQDKGSRAIVTGLAVGPLYVEAILADPRFATSELNDTVDVRYGPLTVNLVGLGPDTVLTLTKRGGFDLKATAVDQYGDTAKGGQFTATTRGRSVKFGFGGGASWGVGLSAFGFGPDTIAVSYSLCSNPCGDTLAVDVKPVPSTIRFLPSWVDSTQGPDNIAPNTSDFVSALNVPVRIPAAILDSAAYPIPGIPLVFQLADSDGHLSLLDSLTGTFLPLINGQTAVRVTGAGITDSVPVHVVQVVHSIELELPAYVVGVGTTFPGTFLAWDSGGTPVDSIIQRWPDWSTEWTMGDTSVAVVASASNSTDSPALLRTQGYGATKVDLTVFEWINDLSRTFQASTQDTVHVIPEPDSVRAYPQDGSTTLSGIGTTATWLGDIYLPDSTITAVPLQWTSLDSAVATIDMHGLVTAVSPGTARIVGSVGAAADTSVVTVVGSGP